MSANVQLEDGEARHREHPETFQIPSDALKRSVRKGDHIKVVADPERFWIEVSEAKWPKFKGTVINNLVFTEIHGFGYGDEVQLEARHIINIKTVEQQQLPTTNFAGEDVAEITVTMLEMELPRVPIARCALDEWTQIFIARVDDGIGVSVFMRTTSNEASTPVDGATYANAFGAAAKSLGLVPRALEETSDDGTLCLFFIMFSVLVTGPELLKQVRESIDSIRVVAQRMLSGGTVNDPHPQGGTLTPPATENARPLVENSSYERPYLLPPWAVESCPQCMHNVRMGDPIPDDEITPAIVELLCPTCRAALPFDKQGCPLSREQLMELFDFVEEQFTSRQDDETLRFAGEFCDREHLPKEATLDWLRSQGGYCDIEVVLNVAPRWSE